ncbi:MAG: D-alanyl-D-alanine carboxypeptidase [Desulfobacterales bacterium]|nr:D-alanyl-D-alanine carboxypeptidase [Desulfobacterales bacterium]
MNKSRLARAILWIALAMGLMTRPAIALPPSTGILLSDETGQIIYSKNADQYFVPASTLKLLISLAALTELGDNYRYPVHLAYDRESKDLYIKGMGDPLFISEAIEGLTRNLVQRQNLKEVRHIVLDNSYFETGIEIPGTGNSLNPYDATIGALCANFNTLAFKWDDGRREFISAEPQTPLLPGPFMEEVSRSGQSKGRILLSPKLQLRYPGELIRHFLNQHGIQVTGGGKADGFPKNPKVQWTLLSPYPLPGVVEKLLRYSNNFIANQLMLTLGAIREGEPANLAKGQKLLGDFAAQLKLGKVNLLEASGLSRRNRITPRQMGKLLMAFKPHHGLLRENGNEFYKTGTLSDVRSRVGYIKGKDKKLYPFAVFLNGQSKGYENIMADLVKRIQKRPRDKTD